MMRWLAVVLVLAPDSSGPLRGVPRGTVRGVVRFAEPQPKKRDDLVVDPNGRVKWAFVYVKEGIAWPRADLPREPALLEIRGGRYEPRVLGMRAGQILRVKNADECCHCVHGIPLTNREFNFHVNRGETVDRKLEHPEVMVRVKDDIHPWMAAWVGVVDHPFFAVSGEDGAFEIKGLPPGKYKVAIWHERLQPAERALEIKPGSGTALEFILGKRRD